MANNGEDQVPFKKYSTHTISSEEEKTKLFERTNNSRSKPAILSIFSRVCQKNGPLINFK